MSRAFRTGANRHSLTSPVCAFGALILTLACLAAPARTSPYQEQENHFSTNTSSPEAISRHIAALEASVRRQLEELEKRQGLGPPNQVPTYNIGSWFLGGIFVIASFGMGLVGVLALRGWNERAELARRNRLGSIMAEDASMADFLRTMHGTPSSNPGSALAGPDANPIVNHEALLKERLAAARAGLQKLSRGNKPEKGLQTVFEILEAVQLIKQSSEATPRLRPAHLLASAVEGLLKQLAVKSSNITPSALRTAAGAIDLLGFLSTHDLRPDLATDPPVRLLAVDDEPISRRALIVSLKKVFGEPDLATDGRIGLGLVERNAYDLILLDVEMPGLDGFELYSKIRQASANCATPVVFVTCHTDFDSRAKMALSGAHELIGKPFLTFEMAVKVLTLVLRARAERDEKPPRKQTEMPAQETHSAKSAKTPAENGGTRRAQASNSSGNHRKEGEVRSAPSNSASSPAQPVPTAGDQAAVTTQQQTACEVPEIREPTKDELVSTFFKRAPVHIRGLRERLTALAGATTPGDRDDLLGDLFIAAHAIAWEAERAQLNAAGKIGPALETVLKKLLSKPTFCTPPALEIVSAAIDIIEQLALAGQDLDLGHAAVRLLVVDDNPLSLRMMSGALQLAFGRPDTADSGEAALVLAEKKSYDLIFLDVLMPGMDGFETCRKLRGLAVNRLTPVVFVTSQDDPIAGAEATAAGGSGFIPKPVLPCQITLVALTSIVRRRLKLRSAEAPEPAEALPSREISLAPTGQS